MTKYKWLLAFIPLILGLITDLILVYRLENVPVLYLRIDLGSFAIFIGSLTTLLLAIGFAFLEWSDHRYDKYHETIQSQFAEERRRFLRRLDHELKNPLTAIRAGLANLSGATTSQTRQEAMASIEAQALRLSRLAADLRKLAELETRPLERSSVDIGHLLEEAYTLALDQPEAELRHLTLSIPQAPWPLPKVPGDADLLFLAVHNLFDNSLKFTRPGDTIEVRSFEDGSMVVIEVADTGPGIPEEDIFLVWEELYRGRGAQGIPGSGLGLALVKAITERHNGTVSLRSRAGQGTVFAIKLPIG